MKLSRHLLAILSLVILFSACKEDRYISGNIVGAANMTVRFDQTNFDRTTLIFDQGKIDESGNFKLMLPETIDPGMYRLRIGARSIDLVLDGSENQIVINADLATMAQLDYSVTGAGVTEEFTSILQQFMKKEMDASQVTKYIKEDASPLAGMMLAYKVFQLRANYANIHRAALDKINATPLVGKDLAIKYGSVVSALESQQKRQQVGSKIKVGQQAPEIALEDPYGKTYKLSDLKGKIVLIDFWASWCKPCRSANPHVVSVYNQYKDQGFTVYSVSLDGLDTRAKKRYDNYQGKINAAIDRSKEQWVAAIEKDNLIWDYHGSDLKKWESLAAAEYGVRNIPQTFLVDREGKIAAVNPKVGLEQQIQKLL